MSPSAVKMGILHKLMKQRCLHAFDHFNTIHRMEYVQNCNKYEITEEEQMRIGATYAAKQRLNAVQDSRTKADHKAKEFTAEHIKRLCKFLKDKSQKKVYSASLHELRTHFHQSSNFYMKNY